MRNLGLIELGNEFVADYYEDDTDFTQKYAFYAEYYCSTFAKQAKYNATKYTSFYYIEDTLDHYELMKPIIEERFKQC